MKKKIHDFESYRSQLKEGISIYEFEDEANNPSASNDEADLDAQTPTPDTTETPTDAPVDAPSGEQAPAIDQEEPAAPQPEPVATPVAQEEPVDFGDGDAISQETAMSELDFVAGIIGQYQKLAKKDVKLDSSMKKKIRDAFKLLK